jgi:hypothetical protein
LVDRDTSHNSKPLLISAPKQGALAFDRGRKGRNARLAHNRKARVPRHAGRGWFGTQTF